MSGEVEGEWVGFVEPSVDPCFEGDERCSFLRRPFVAEEPVDDFGWCVHWLIVSCGAACEKG